MLENRSFDHVFGFSPINGTNAVTIQPTTTVRPDPAVNSNMDTEIPSHIVGHDLIVVSEKGKV